MNSTQNELAVKLGKILSAGEWSIATAESCTGGLMAAIITDVPACSGWFERDYVEYGYPFATGPERQAALVESLKRIAARLAKLNPPPIGPIEAMVLAAARPDCIVAELGEVLIGAASGRTDSQQVTLFKSLGLAVEDVAAAIVRGDPLTQPSGHSASGWRLGRPSAWMTCPTSS